METVRLFMRLSRMTSTRLTKRVFLWDMDQPRGWCSEVLVTIGNSGYHGDWQDLPTGLINSAREHLQATYVTNWLADVNSMPKLRTYKLIKTTFEVERYVQCTMQKNLRSALARLRMGVFPIRIETGRWRGLPLDERTCVNCTMGVVESEQHFLCACPKHNSLRDDLMQQIRINMNNDIGQLCADAQLKYLLCTKDIRTIVGKFIISAHQNRL